MDNPSDLLRRAAQNRRALPARPGATEGESALRAGAASAPAPDGWAAQPHHASYDALMRSHDRLRTRHLPVQGGGNRA